MKTRTLLLLSVACGLAIMLAGAVLLVQLAGQGGGDEPLAVGDLARVGDMRVTVTEATETDGRLAIVVAIGGTADDAPADDFRLVASGRSAALADTTCEPIEPDDIVERTCAVVFDVSGADGSSRVLVYERGDERARWLLA